MSDLRSRLKNLEGRGRPDKPSMILVASGDNFRDKGSGEVFTQSEARDLEARNKAVLVELRVVARKEAA